ncbi:MAG: AAA family ATPase [Desulfobacterales bacterium]
MLSDFEEQVKEANGQQIVRLINAADWLETDPPEPDQIIKDILDTGDKLVIIGSSKMRKSFWVDQLALSLVSGKNFLKFCVPKARRVMLCQFEIRSHHKHRRIKRLSKAMSITSKDIGNRLQILNGRGLGLTGPEGIESIYDMVSDFQPEVIIFDPLYKLSSGVENAAEDMKILLAEFDRLAEQTGAAIIYVHHDAKGSPGDRDIRDRGAGSNVLGRDYDACFTMTAHEQNPDATVIDILLRNYQPQESFSVVWDCQDNGYCFRLADDIVPEKKTGRSKQTPPPLTTYLPIAENIFNQNGSCIDIATFKTLFKEKTALSDNRIKDFLNWAQAGGKPYIEATEERARGHYKKTLNFIRCDHE